MCTNGITSEELEEIEEDEGRYNEEIQKILSEINVCQESINKINVFASEEIFDVEGTYSRLRKPKYEKRQEIISRIPDFWVNVLLNHPHIKSILYTEEEDCLYYLSKIEVEETEDIKSGYSIKFFFNENPYFENEILIKERNLELCGEESSLRTIINWKDHYFAEKIKRINNSRKRCMEPKSFFGWLTDDSNPFRDYTADVIKYEIWRSPLLYFSVHDLLDDNEAISYGDMNIDEEEEEEEEEEECEDEYMETEEEIEDEVMEEEEEVEEFEDEVTLTEKEEEVEEYDDEITIAEKEENIEEYDDEVTIAEKEEEIEEYDDEVTLAEKEDEIEEYDDEVSITEKEEKIEECDNEVTITEKEENIEKCNDEVTLTEKGEKIEECDVEVTITEKEENIEKCNDEVTITEKEEEIEESDNEVTITEKEDEIEEHDNEVTITEKEDEIEEYDNEVTITEKEEKIKECCDEDVTEIKEDLVEKESKIEEESGESLIF